MYIFFQKSETSFRNLILIYDRAGMVNILECGCADTDLSDTHCMELEIP